MAEETPEARGRRMLHESGYGSEETARKAQDRQRGGRVHGEKAESRPDRRARGGEVGGKHRGKPAVNIKIAAGGGGGDPQREQQALAMGRQQGMAVGAKLGARAAAQKMAGAPPPGAGGPPPGGLPTVPPGAGGPPGQPVGPMRRGGTVKRAGGGGSMPDDIERRPAGEGAEPNDSPIKVRAHERKCGGRC